MKKHKNKKKRILKVGLFMEKRVVSMIVIWKTLSRNLKYRIDRERFLIVIRY